MIYMVGIVIVSHSAKIAAGIKDLVDQMVRDHERFFAVGGTSDGSLGTNPVAIQKVIEKADMGDGVVVLADLGSAVMSVGLVKEMLDSDLSQRVILADAPIVEGAVSAAVEASFGSSLQKVVAAAQAARQIEKIC